MGGFFDFLFHLIEAALLLLSPLVFSEGFLLDFRGASSSFLPILLLPAFAMRQILSWGLWKDSGWNGWEG